MAKPTTTSRNAATAKAPANKTAAADTGRAESAMPAVPVSDCVVDDGTAHMGNAVHGGKVCSAHEMHYRSDGSRRVPLESSAITSVPGPRIKR